MPTDDRRQVCEDDTGCVALDGAVGAERSVCLVNDALGEGVCMPEHVCLDGLAGRTCLRACFMHEHCIREDRLCSGRGLCEEPRVSVHNHMPDVGPDRGAVEVQVFAAGCTQSTYGLSQFEGVEDFATTNGLCGARRRFRYSREVDGALETKTVGRAAHATRRVPDRGLAEAGVLRARPHACDRSYQHSEYGVCASDDPTSGVAQVSETDADGRVVEREHARYVWALQTWVREDGLPVARFCNIRERSQAVGFLSPYRYFPVGGAPEDTLAYVPQTLLDCGAFETCPTVNFRVHAEPVYRHVFRMIARAPPAVAEAAPAIEPLLGFASGGAQRTWSNVDGDVCFGQGYRIQDTDLGLTRRCVVDRSAVPLLTVLFGRAAASEHLTPLTYCANSDTFCDPSMENKFKLLRTECVNAFGEDEDRALVEFKRSFVATTREYSHDQRKSVLDAVNGLLPWVFGIHPVHGTGRGFELASEYLAHSKCARFVIRRLHEVRGVAPSMHYKRDVPAVDVTAGTSLYFFQDRAAVYMPFRWFWQCVVLDSSPTTGAPSDWLATLANPAASDSSLRCLNYASAPDADADRVGLGTHREVTFGTLLRQSRHIFGRSDGVTTADNWIHDDMEQLVKEALATMQLTTMPNVMCVQAPDADAADGFGFLFPLIDENERSDNKPTVPLTAALTEENIADMVLDKVRRYLWESGSGEASAYSADDFVLLTTDQMKTLGIMKDRGMDTVTHEDATIVPATMFTGLVYETLKQTIPLQYRYPYASPLGFTKYQDGALADPTEYAVPDQATCGTRLRLIHHEFGVLDAFNNPDRARDPTVRFVPRALLGPIPDRFLADRAVFTQEQVRYLVLQFMRVYMPLQAFMNGDKLVAVQDPEVREAMRLHAGSKSSKQYLHEGAFNLNRYQRYNRVMQAKTFECDEFMSIDHDAETNDGFQELRTCYEALQVKTGWVVQHDEYLHLVLTAAMMTQGFFAAFAAREIEKHGEFVDNMTKPEWASAEWRGEDRYQKCFSRAGQAELMNPALPGVFDTDIGCETARNADGTWTVDSACDETCNERDPGLAAWLTDNMPAGCAARHESIVARPQRLNKPYHTPVCDRRFQPPSVCARAHGTLGGRQGAAVTDLYTSGSAGVQPGGLWANGVLRSSVDADADADADADGADALSLLRTDIGGHALEFAVPFALLCCLCCWRCPHTCQCMRDPPALRADTRHVPKCALATQAGQPHRPPRAGTGAHGSVGQPGRLRGAAVDAGRRGDLGRGPRGHADGRGVRQPARARPRLAVPAAAAGGGVRAGTRLLAAVRAFPLSAFDVVGAFNAVEAFGVLAVLDAFEACDVVEHVRIWSHQLIALREQIPCRRAQPRHVPAHHRRERHCTRHRREPQRHRLPAPRTLHVRVRGVHGRGHRGLPHADPRRHRGRPAALGLAAGAVEPGG